MTRTSPIPLLFLMLLLLPVVAAGQNLLNNPESVVYDQPRDRYLVSNFGDGNIVQMDALMQQSYFDTTLTRIAGLYIDGDMLYVASNLDPYVGLVGYDLTTDLLTTFVRIPESVLLNDLAVDNARNLYITDYWDTKVFRIDLDDLSYEIFAVAGLQDPNGIIYDEPNNRMIVSSTAPGFPLHGIDLTDGSVSVVVYTNVSSQDGFARDNDGNLYFSTWINHSVYRYDPQLTSPPTIVSSGHAGPADIYFDRVNNLLCVPNYYTNSVDFVPFTQTAIPSSTVTTQVSLAQNYPDPFNPTTIIEYSLPTAAQVRIDVFNCAGQLVDTVIDRWAAAGEHQTTWSGAAQPSGRYFYRLQAAGVTETRQMTLLK